MKIQFGGQKNAFSIRYNGSIQSHWLIGDGVPSDYAAVRARVMAKQPLTRADGDIFDSVPDGVEMYGVEIRETTSLRSGLVEGEIAFDSLPPLH